MLRRSHGYGMILGVGLLCILCLSGCDFLAEIFRFNTDDADAQSSGGLSDDPVITIVIEPGSFSIEADSIDFSTNVTVQNEVTIYRQITGEVHFTLSRETDVRTLNLSTADVIIERPGSNLLTIIRP